MEEELGNCYGYSFPIFAQQESYPNEENEMQLEHTFPQDYLSESRQRESPQTSSTSPQLSLIYIKQFTPRNDSSGSSSQLSLKSSDSSNCLGVTFIETSYATMDSKSLEISETKQRLRTRGSKNAQKHLAITSKQISTRLPRSLLQTPVFYIVGNVLLDFRSTSISAWHSSEENDIERNFDSGQSFPGFSYFKAISSVETSKQKGEMTIRFRQTVKPISEFAFLKYYLSGVSQSQTANQVGDLLELYSKTGAKVQREFLLRLTEILERHIIDMGKQSDQFYMQELFAHRYEVLNRHSQELLSAHCTTNPADVFYVISHYTADFEALEYNLSSFTLSYPLLALCGFSTSLLANGLKCPRVALMKLSPYTRMQMVIQLLQDWTEENANPERSSIIDPYRFLTIDGLTITCKAKRVRKRVQMSEYFGKNMPKGAIDIVVITFLDIDAFTIRRVLGARENVDIDRIALEQLEDIEYSVKSELFIEKHYQEDAKTIQNIPYKLKQTNRTCNYRTVTSS